MNSRISAQINSQSPRSHLTNFARVSSLALAISTLFVSSNALADIRKEGVWPADETKISLALERTSRREALRALGEVAHWNLIVSNAGDDMLDIKVADESAEKVLATVLDDGNWVAKRDGSLISIRRETTTQNSSPPPPTVPTSAPPVAVQLPEAPLKDVEITGKSSKVSQSDVVSNVRVMGGSLDVYGTVMGNVDVMGGKVHVKKGARVLGNISVLGGSVHVHDGARVDGSVTAVGGKVTRDDKHSSQPTPVASGQANNNSQVSLNFSPNIEERRGFFANAADKISHSMSSSSLLFVFGAVLLALLPKSMQAMKLDIATRPMRSFALGVVGLIAAIATFALLCITLIGIPVAVVGLIAAVMGAYAGVCVSLQTVGELLTRHRTENPYIHLALGCFFYFVISVIPWVGSWATAILALIGLGLAFSWILDRKKPLADQLHGAPYRA